ncbi:hypothetical protein BZG02_14545 [Labilibaculum filiforme]|uniref:Lipocalin-like domain-containing protein n=1 Tax=Labilibaculum filiforme TaxID=1940526 RepID=A0A2N3HUY6_9BACT|nr:hypothetical protein [Labilibaculum filiforme]PKQ61841.1 hypothetical protein BZG02_14545 [Labilibaculum filiforme]
MNIFKQILLAFLTVVCLVSCDKEDTDEKSEILDRVSINAKWVVEGTSEFKSFEFNESGNYIVIKESTTKSSENNSILFGTYEYDDDKTLILSDLGTIIISDFGTDNITFVVNGTSGDITLNANKQKEMDRSEQTDLFCRTWKMSSLNGVDVAGTDLEMTVVFSRSGTYFVKYVKPVNGIIGGLAKWSWLNTKKTEFVYSWELSIGNEDEGTVEIIEVTSDMLKVLEVFEDGEEELSILVPVAN